MNVFEIKKRVNGKNVIVVIEDKTGLRESFSLSSDKIDDFNKVKDSIFNCPAFNTLNKLHDETTDGKSCYGGANSLDGLVHIFVEFGLKF